MYRNQYFAILMAIGLFIFYGETYSQTISDTAILHKQISELELQLATQQKLHNIELAEQAESLRLAHEEENRKYQSQRTGIYFGMAGALAGLVFAVYGVYSRNKKINAINADLEIAYKDLKNTQQQLIQSEKMAAFGLMASRVSHEISNPLNFINNFSELSRETLDAIINAENDIEKSEQITILSSNLQKIYDHGKRAESIVKQLQEHSNKGTAHEFFTEG